MTEAERQKMLMVATYIAKTGATVRNAAEFFGMSKSKVHYIMTKRLVDENPIMYEKVRYVMKKNKSERHLRGGAATKKKYSK